MAAGAFLLIVVVTVLAYDVGRRWLPQHIWKRRGVRANSPKEGAWAQGANTQRNGSTGPP
jgi:hypothetical protein